MFFNDLGEETTIMRKKLGNENEKIKKIFLIILMIVFFWQLRNIFFTTDDDIMYYIATQNGTIKNLMFSMAESQGRVRMILTWPVIAIPFLISNKWYIIIISYSFVALNIGMYYFILKKRLGKDIAFVSLVIFLIFYSNNLRHNLLTSYPVYLQLPLTFLILSIELFLQYFDSGKRIKLIISAILFTISLSFYEGFITYIPVFFYLAWLNTNDENRLVSIVKQCKYHIIMLILYLVIHSLYALMHKSSYDGTQMNIKNLVDFFMVVWKFSTGLFPMVSYSHLNGLDKIYLDSNVNVFRISKIRTVDLAWIIKGILASVFIIMSFEKIKNTQNKMNRLIVLVPLILYCIFIPSIPLALTTKYQGWVKDGDYSYTVSYYSYYFIILFLVVMIWLFYNMKVPKKMKNTVIIIIITIVTVCTSYNNYYIGKAQEIEVDKNILLNKLLKSDYFKEIPDGSYIYASGYRGIHRSMSFSEQYIKDVTGKTIIITNEIENLDFAKNVYILNHYVNNENKEQEIIIGKVKEDFLSKEIFILKNKKIGTESLILTDKNNVITIIPFNSESKSYLFKGVKSFNIIDVKTINKILQSDNMNKVTINFRGEFFELEGSENDNWRWSGNLGMIELKNDSHEEIKLKMEMGISTYSEKLSKMTIYESGSVEKEILNINFKPTMYIETIDLNPDEVKIFFFISDEKRMETNDPRNLVYRIQNFKYEILR